MSNNSSSNDSRLGRPSSSSGAKPTPRSTNSSGVREFLYLDLLKLFSYLSQIRGGRELLIERVEQQFSIDEKSEPTMTRLIKGEVDAELSGKIPLIAEGTIQGQVGGEQSTTSGDVRNKSGRMGQRMTLNIIYCRITR